MTWTAAGSVSFVTTTSFTWTPAQAGNLIVLFPFQVTNGTTTVTNVSSSNASWAAGSGNYSGTHQTGTTSIFLGTATSTSAATVNVTWSAGTPATLRFAVREFHSSLGGWSVGGTAHVDSTGTNTDAALTCTAGNLYVAFDIDSATAVAGSTTGFTYQVDATHGNGLCYNLNTGAGSIAPVWGDSTHVLGRSIALVESSNVSISDSDVGHGTDSGSPTAYTLFPTTGTLPVTVELFYNGTWQDITGYVYARSDIQISYGRQDEASSLQPSSMTLVLDNRDGSFSPLNTSSQFYPYLLRNTQIRVSVDAMSTASVINVQKYRYWGEVSKWPPTSDISGNDVTVTVTASGPLRRYAQGGLLGSALKRFYTLKSTNSPLYPIAMWTCEDGVNSTQFSPAVAGGNAMTWTGTPTLASDTNFNGTDPLPLFSKSVWTGNTGSYSFTGPVTFSTPGTYQWLCPGGVTSLTSAQCWGAGGGGANGRANDASTGGAAGGGGEFASEATVAVTPGSFYTVVVGTGGQGGQYRPNITPSQRAGGDGGSSSFMGDVVTVTANGGSGAQAGTGGAGGTGSTNTTHFNGGAGANHSGTVTIPAHGNYGGAGGGGSGGTAASGNAGTTNSTSTDAGGAGATAVTGGGKGGAGGKGATKAANGVPGGLPGGGGGGGGENFANSYAGYAGGAGASGKVVLNYTATTTPQAAVVRFLLDVPAHGMPDTAVIARANIASGSLTKVELSYGTVNGGSLRFQGFNGGTTVFDTGYAQFFGTGVNGVPFIASLELQIIGSNLQCSLIGVKPGATSGSATTNINIASGTLGAVSSIVMNPGGTIDDTGCGFVILQYAWESLLNFGGIDTDISGAANGWAGENAATRLQRLVQEEGLVFGVNGSASDTALMGPQRDLKFLDLLQECEDADQGQLYEDRGALGFSYNTRVHLQNQAAWVTLDYSQHQLSQVPQPQYDDQLTRNDVTVQRIGGGSVNNQQTTGTMSVALPPTGAGDYSYTLQANLNADSQLANMAQWIVDKGTVDDYRYPGIACYLESADLATQFSAVSSLQVGKYYQVTNLPSWMPSSTVKQILYGWTENINAYSWRFTFNGAPESPYEGAGLPTW